MDFKLILVALFALLAGLANNSLANDSEVESIDYLIKRLEHVLEIQARPEHELDDIIDDIGEDELETIDGELSHHLHKRSRAWDEGTYGGDRLRKGPVAPKSEKPDRKSKRRRARRKNGKRAILKKVKDINAWNKVDSVSFNN